MSLIERDPRWRPGEPPRDGRVYEMRQRCAMSGGPPWTAWLGTGWWDGSAFVRRNQMHGGTDTLLFCTHWRRPGGEPLAIGNLEAAA